ncbi:MAG: enoyl-CoA hydratase-related protein, partial [Thermosulfidibacteraceae bacterium]
GLTETSLAIIPGAGGTQRLPRIVGISKAKELIYLAKRITAEEAMVIGLVNEVVERERLLDRAFEIAREIAKKGPIAISQAKYAINRGYEVDIKSGLEIETKA